MTAEVVPSFTIKPRSRREILQTLLERNPEGWARLSGLFAMLALPAWSHHDAPRRFECQVNQVDWLPIASADIGERIVANTAQVPVHEIVIEVRCVIVDSEPDGHLFAFHVPGGGVPAWRPWRSSVVVESFLVAP